MFLGHLSAATERNARKKSDKKNKSKADEGISGESTTNSLLRRAPKSSDPAHIKYTSELGTIPRDVLLDFLQTCVKMLLDEGNMLEMIRESVRKGQGLDVTAVEFQRDIIENNFCIERNFGCKYLSQLGDKFADDDELLTAAEAFMFNCQKSYVECLRLRSRLYKRGELQAPEPDMPMGRTAILEFFEGCSALMILPETRVELLSLAQQQLPVNKRVIEMQREMIQTIGFEPDHGIQYLNRVQLDYRGDQQVLLKMQCFGLSAQIACQTAAMPAAQRDEFYAQMPRLMRPFPQMFILQQRTRSMMQQQQMMHGAAGAGREQEVEALKQSGLLSLLSSPDGRAQVQRLSARVQTSKEKMAAEVGSWSSDRKADFYHAFADQPLLQLLRESGDDPLAKISVFLEMPDEHLDNAMALLLIVSENDGELLNKLRENLVANKRDEDTNAWINSVATVMGSLANMRRPAQPQACNDPSHGHDHGHSHGHGHGHGHGHDMFGMHTMPDISTQRAATMER